MRKVIVIDPEKLNGRLENLNTGRYPNKGEFVECVTGVDETPVAVGTVTNVRPYPGWDGRWQYDVLLRENGHDPVHI